MTSWGPPTAAAGEVMSGSNATIVATKTPIAGLIHRLRSATGSPCVVFLGEP